MWQFQITTRTPLWTGGLDGTMDRIHETGIIGSLRWWYEAIVRGLGGSACDPSEHTCSFDLDKYRRSNATDERQRLRDAGLCDVCQVFGATGWRRRFRVSIIEDRTRPAWEPRDKALNIRPPERARGWYLLPGYVGTFTLGFEGEEKTISLLASLFLWLEKFGTLGARPQLGYGAFRILNRSEVLKTGRKWQWNVLRTVSPNQDGKNKALEHPDLRRFLFFRYEFTPSSSRPGWWTMVPGIGRVGSQVQPLVSQLWMVPTTPALKNEWRFHQWHGNRRDELEIFGTLRPERRRGRISATWAYKENDVWFIHGWVWMPREENQAQHLWGMLTNTAVWDEVLGVKGKLTTFPTQRWREQEYNTVRRLLQERLND